MSERTDAFVTATGLKIDYVPGYFEYMRDVVGIPDEIARDIELASANFVGGKDQLDYGRASELGETNPRISLLNYSARLASVYKLRQLLEQANVPNSFRKVLDIGCGYGVQPRLLKALGMVDHSVGIDLYDRATAIDENYLLSLHRKLKLLRYLDWYTERLKRKPEGSLSEFQRAVLYKATGPRDRIHAATGWRPAEDFYRMRFTRAPKLDKMITGNVYDVAEKFDLVTAFSSIEWFVADEILEKVSSILEPGGVFYMYVANWWHATTAGRVFGHFPFLPQRLTTAELSRYLDENHPEHAAVLKGHQSFFDPMRPTMKDYVAAGNKHGLLAVRFESYVAPQAFSRKYGITSRGWGELENRQLTQALDAIHKYRSDIALTDLLPVGHYIVFTKVDRNRRVGNSDFERLKANTVDLKYRPSNWLLAKGRLAARRFLRRK